MPPDWLEPLVSALNGTSDVGAACPKILLEGTYAQVQLTTAPEPRWRGDPRSRGVRLVDVVPPPDAVGSVRHSDGFFEPEHCGARTFRWTMPDATLFVPVPPDRPGSLACTIVLDSDRAKQVRVTSGEHDTVLDVHAGCHRYDIQLDGERFDVINNVGSVLLPSGYGVDRGWLEPDRGQYESGEDVFAWCGGAVLLRSEYLRDVGVFDERLFLYYEDLELSWRGRRRGWRYRYVPRSVVRHAHSATARAGLDAGALLQRAQPAAGARSSRRVASLRPGLRSLPAVHGVVRQTRAAWLPCCGAGAPAPTSSPTRLRSLSRVSGRAARRTSRPHVTSRSARR